MLRRIVATGKLFTGNRAGRVVFTLTAFPLLSFIKVHILSGATRVIRKRLEFALQLAARTMPRRDEKNAT
jgi:hypothetical protein